MTELKKRFQKLVPEHFGGMQHDLMASCEIIAQDFAKGFAKWCRSGEFKEDFFNKEKSLNEMMKLYEKTLE